MKLTNEVVINRSPQEVFDTLLDVERVATCMPGSKLLGRLDENTYQGEVKIKVGPLGAAYTGTVRFLDIDRTERTATLKASGKEQRGQGNADAHVTARVLPEGAGAKVVIDTDLMIRGKVAQFGRGVIGEVSQRLIGQFAGNMEQLLAGGPQLNRQASSAATTEPAAIQAQEQPAAAIDGIGLVLGPLLKRAAPVAAGAAIGLLIGLGLRGRSSKVIEVVLKLDQSVTGR